MLADIAREIEACNACKKHTSGKAVPGEGSAKANVVFIGEAPGRKEAATGRPFVGRSGQLLRRLIRDAGFREDEVYITSPVKYLPDRGTPTKKQIEHGKTHLDTQLAVIGPKVIVLLGKTACTAMLERTVPILKEHGKIISDHGRHYLIALHPAAVIRFPKYKKLIEEDFIQLKTKLRKHIL